nr:MAG TPA: hypothetical protein [Caudoviricetes sp.]
MVQSIAISRPHFSFFTTLLLKHNPLLLSIFIYIFSIIFIGF